MKVTSEHFGTLPDKREALLFTLENGNGITAKITNYGGTVISLEVPDKNKTAADIVLGIPGFNGWLDNASYFNCIVGRTCNRIAGARFSIDGKEILVSANNGEIQLHGGFHGFHHKLWNASTLETENGIGIELSYLSSDGEEGFPGNLLVKARYLLSETNELSLEFFATTDQATPVNLTNHFYFNLAGEGSGSIYDHELTINSDQITETDKNSIPTGQFTQVAGTPFDFTQPKTIGARINSLYKGYDDNFVLRNQSGELALAAVVSEPVSGRILEILTTEPGIQLYTSNWFDGSVEGKCGKPHQKHSAFCLETQHYPDSMNHPEFPDVILRPGEQYYSKTVWRFLNR